MFEVVAGQCKKVCKFFCHKEYDDPYVLNNMKELIHSVQRNTFKKLKLVSRKEEHMQRGLFG